jgi:dephospho-CoA kinase
MNFNDISPSTLSYNILVLGYSESGKTTAAEIVAQLTGSPPPINCSDIIIRDFAAENGLEPSEVLANKSTYRQQLFAFGKAIQDKDPAYPVPEAYKTTRVVTGVRTVKSLGSVRNYVDLIIWIDRDAAKQNTTDELGPEHADVVVDNNGSLDDLKIKLIAALQEN